MSELGAGEPHLIEGRGEEEVRRAPPIDENVLDIHHNDVDRNDEGISMRVKRCVAALYSESNWDGGVVGERNLRPQGHMLDLLHVRAPLTLGLQRLYGSPGDGEDNVVRSHHVLHVLGWHLLLQSRLRD